MLTPWLSRQCATAAGRTSRMAARWTMGTLLAATLAGGGSRLAARPAAELAAGRLLPSFQRRLPQRDQRATCGWWAACCASVRSCWLVYGGLLGLTYFDSSARRKASSRTGHGLLDGQRAAARLGLDGAHRAGDAADRADRPGDARHQARRPASAGQSFVLNAAGSNFGSMFVNLKRLSRAPRPEPVQRRHRRHSCASDSARRSRTRMVAVFGPPPVRGVGRAGGFALMIEDRGDLGPAALAGTKRDNLRRQGQVPARPAAACSPSSGPTCRSCTFEPDPRACMMRGVQLAGFRRHAAGLRRARSTSTISTCSAAPGR